MKEILKKKVSTSVDENLNYMKEILYDTTDFIFRDFYFSDGLKAGIVYIDGLADKMLVNDYAMEPLLENKNNLSDPNKILKHLLEIADVGPRETLEEGIDAVLKGDTLLMIDGLDNVYVLGTRAWPNRGIGEPAAETTVKGSREGLSETIRFNTALIRRRIRDTRLRTQGKSVGSRSKTDVVLMYIDDICDEKLLNEVENRIDDINIDAILDSSYLEQCIEDSKYSVFPQVQSTERPDVVSAALYEGRIAILVDNSPQVLLVPATLPELFQSPDDYYERWTYATVIRFLRVFALVMALLAPAMYVATTMYHVGVIPTQFAYSIAASRNYVPFPPVLEAIFMEIAFVFILEATLKLPKAVGSTFGVVSGLVVGQSAVTAGLVSPVMIVIVGVTAIATFMIPNQSLVSGFRMVRFLLIIAAGFLGMYGIIIGIIILVVHLVGLKSFGVPYLAPFNEFKLGDMQDSIIKLPLTWIKRRPEFLKPKDKVRQK